MGTGTIKELMSAKKITISDYGNVPHKIIYDFYWTNSELHTMSDFDFNELKNYLTKEEFENLSELRNGGKNEDTIAQKPKAQHVSGSKTKKSTKANSATFLASENTLAGKKVGTKVASDDTGAPIGMDDDILTPGSIAWKLKYNQQAPEIATSDTESPIGSTTVSSKKFRDGTALKRKGHFYIG
jgi:hypothetical protein